MGNYVFSVILNDGYLFGPNESSPYPLEVEITSRSNNLPYFAAPGLTPLKFFCEGAFTYELPETADDDNDGVIVSFDNTETPWLKLSYDQKRLEVEAGSTEGPSMVKDYEIMLTLEDDNIYGPAGTQSLSFTLTIEIPPNTLPTFEDGTLQTEFSLEVEKAWSYQLPFIVSEEAKDIITVQITSDGNLPWLNADSDTKIIFILEGAAYGNSTIGLHQFNIVLNDNNLYGLSTTSYPITINITPYMGKVNTLPQFTGGVMVALDKLPLWFIIGETWKLSLPDILDEE